MIVRVYSKLDELPDSHRVFCNTQTAEKFLYSLYWFENIIRSTLESFAEVRLYAVEDDANDNALRCLFPARTPACKLGSVLRYRMTGSRTLSGLTTNKTILFAPIYCRHDPNLSEVFGALAAYLRTEKPAWELIDMAAIEMEPEVFAVFKAAFRRVGYSIQEYRNYSNWHEPISGNFQAYLESLPQRNQKAIKNYIRKYKKEESSGSASLRIYNNSEEIDKAIRDYHFVFGTSWKGTDVHSSFISDMIRTGIAAGKARLLLLYVDKNPAAVELAFIHGKVGVMYRTAFNPAYTKLSVGSIAILKMIEYLANVDKVSQIDFGRDDEEYKNIWATNQKYRCGLLAFNPYTAWGVYGYLRNLFSLLRDAAASRLKSYLKPLATKLKSMRK